MSTWTSVCACGPRSQRNKAGSRIYSNIYIYIYSKAQQCLKATIVTVPNRSSFSTWLLGKFFLSSAVTSSVLLQQQLGVLESGCLDQFGQENGAPSVHFLGLYWVRFSDFHPVAFRATCMRPHLYFLQPTGTHASQASLTGLSRACATTSGPRRWTPPVGSARR